MIGRTEELKHLQSLYSSGTFEYLVMYGRRRVGKTTILQEFSKGKNAVFYIFSLKSFGSSGKSSTFAPRF